MSIPKKHLIKKVSAVAVVLGAVALMWALASDYLQPQEEGIEVLQTVACDLPSGGCQATSGNRQIHFAIDTEQVASFVPLDFRVQLAGLAADKVSIDFQGVDMFMGSNQLELTRQDDGSYTGTRILPGHIDHSMVWRAKVFVHEGETVTAAWFDFEAR